MRDECNAFGTTSSVAPATNQVTGRRVLHDYQAVYRYESPQGTHITSGHTPDLYADPDGNLAKAPLR